MHPAMKKAVFALSLTAAMSACAMPPASVDTRQPTQQVITNGASPSRLIESAFSPEAGAEALVLKVINSAQQELRLAAYSYTSLSVTKALVSAKKRGVDVRLVVDLSLIHI